MLKNQLFLIGREELPLYRIAVNGRKMSIKIQEFHFQNLPSRYRFIKDVKKYRAIF